METGEDPTDNLCKIRQQTHGKLRNHTPLYIRFSTNKVVSTKEIEDDMILIDYDANGLPVGMELLSGFSIEAAPTKSPFTSSHICDYRCMGESGHHSWPSPRAGECLCNHQVNNRAVYCPMHATRTQCSFVEGSIRCYQYAEENCDFCKLHQKKTCDCHKYTETINGNKLLCSHCGKEKGTVKRL